MRSPSRGTDRGGQTGVWSHDRRPSKGLVADMPSPRRLEGGTRHLDARHRANPRVMGIGRLPGDKWRPRITHRRPSLSVVQEAFGQGGSSAPPLLPIFSPVRGMVSWPPPPSGTRTITPTPQLPSTPPPPGEAG